MTRALPLLEWGVQTGMEYKAMYFQLAAKVADALDILLKAQQEGEVQFMNGEPGPGLKVLAIQDENRDSE
ncbi:hypothetical protein [Desulfosporosinus youngiae]|uniref:Uncharacterized protein n=1 Tax=Desulfosporosinus youngiae DSM 17734 TaxID=768710 RepID=H5XVC1_9FIRM|nr:hypothetical protein [Desulfosporosinus youngiae]EHQ89857.1 hypothetical protein DesyoDRAFT_2808 [Desulfosporosinus youngiae DSM 17734]